jgi:hypothetical protein
MGNNKIECIDISYSYTSKNTNIFIFRGGGKVRIYTRITNATGKRLANILKNYSPITNDRVNPPLWLSYHINSSLSAPVRRYAGKDNCLP